MNTLVTQYFREGPNFEKVIFLNEASNLGWNDIVKMIPDFSRGWFELSRISVENRIHFTYDFWLDRLPFHVNVYPALDSFFGKLGDVGVVLVYAQEMWSSELIYSFHDNSSFFRGLPGASLPDLEEMKVGFGFSWPRDYLSFMKMHNGFGHLSEMGLLKLEDLARAKRDLTHLVLKSDRIIKSGAVSIDPGALYPFYEVYGLSSFQCFYRDWYPTSEMGNIYFSGMDYKVSDTQQEKYWSDQLAFPTFLEWLVYYLEGMSISL
jgi:hypothetical protein